jgi:hypothetical protein
MRACPALSNATKARRRTSFESQARVDLACLPTRTGYNTPILCSFVHAEGKWRHRGRALMIALQIVALFGMCVPARPAQAQSSAPVLAFYYTWYSSDTWSGGKTSDVAAQPYNSTDPAAIARHVDQARGAGIDGFIASWYGPDGGVNNQTQSNFLQLLDIASARGFHAAVDVETYSPFFGDTAAVANALSYAINTLGAHPAYLRYGGKPVLFFWANNRFSPDEWAAIRAQVDPNHTSLWIAEGTSTQWLSVFDGLHLYNVAWSSDFAATAAKFARLARDMGKLWVGTAMPGWDDTRVPGRAGAYAKDRAGGQFYRASFAGAAASAPDMLAITSFNEWMEGSQIEPSVSYGNTYLDLTRELVGAFRAGGLSAPASQGAMVQVSATEIVTVAPTEIPATEAPTEISQTDTPAPPTETPSPTSLFATPVAYVAAVPLAPTATAKPSATATYVPSPTMIQAKLPAVTPDTTRPAQSSGALLMLIAGVVIVGGVAVAAGMLWRRGR